MFIWDLKCQNLNHGVCTCTYCVLNVASMLSSKICSSTWIMLRSNPIMQPMQLNLSLELFQQHYRQESYIPLQGSAAGSNLIEHSTAAALCCYTDPHNSLHYKECFDLIGCSNPNRKKNCFQRKVIELMTNS